MRRRCLLIIIMLTVVLVAVSRHAVAGSFDVRQALEDSASIQGNVIDAATGKPVEAVVLLISRNPPREIGTRTVATSNGRFELDGLSTGNATVIVRAEGFAPTTATVALTKRETAIEIPIQRAASIQGIVLDPDGTPVARAKVVPMYAAGLRDKPILEGLVGGRMDTREDGAFHLRNLVPGVPIHVTALDVRGRRASTGVVLEPGQQISNLRLQFVRP